MRAGRSHLALHERLASWLHAARVNEYARLIVLSSPAFLALTFALGITNGGDFVAFWSAATLVVGGHAPTVYDTPAFLAFEGSLGLPPDRPLLSPPPFLALFAVLGTLPYAAAFAVFMAGTFGAYALAVRWFPKPLYWPALAFPAGLVCAFGGQTGFLTAALLIGACGLLPRHKLVAGLLVGLLIIKPQLAGLAPVALLAGREWRTIFAAAATVLLSLGLTALWLSPETFAAFLAQATFTSSLLTGSNDVSAKLQTVLGEAYALGLPGALGWTLQGLSAALAAFGVWRVWRGSDDPLTRAAALCAAAPLATPYLFVYDLPLLAAPIAWLTAQSLKRGLQPRDKLALLALWFAPAAMVLTIGVFPLTPLLAAGLLLALVRGYGASCRAAMTAPALTVVVRPEVSESR